MHENDTVVLNVKLSLSLYGFVAFVRMFKKKKILNICYNERKVPFFRNFPFLQFYLRLQSISLYYTEKFTPFRRILLFLCYWNTFSMSL